MTIMILEEDEYKWRKGKGKDLLQIPAHPILAHIHTHRQCPFTFGI
uniref:Uncharacterized protein n=1 Tax=Rhizophora mucronata TaxID=61149 RepID=A0A2P2NKL7_RHIMU